MKGTGDASAQIREGITPLAHTTTDRLFAGTVVGGLLFLMLSKSPNRVAWMALGAAVGAFIIPRFVQAFRTPDDRIDWALVNPFGPAGPEPFFFLTGN
jgi:hypothetical protein